MDNLEYNRVVTKLREIGRDAESRSRLGARSRELSQQGISKKVALVWMGLPKQRNVQAISPEMIIEATDTPFYAAPLNRRAICELFKTFEDLGLGKYHPTSGAGHPEGTIELFANCNDIGNAALGFAHLLDVVRPQDKPLTGTARDQHIADRLMRMAELRPVNDGRILAWLAAASHMEDGTSVQSVSDANQVAEPVVSDLFRILETIGVGRYVEASSDAPARMEWYASSQEVGRAACGMAHDLRVAGPSFRDDDIVVERPGGLINRVRNGDDEAAILIDVQRTPEPNDNGKLLNLKMISTLGSFGGEIRLNKDEDWRTVLAEMPTQDFLEFFGGDRSRAPIHAEATKVAFQTLAYGTRSAEIPKALQDEARTYVMNALSFLENGGAEMEEIFLERVAELSCDYPALCDLEKHVQRAKPEEVNCIELLWRPFQENLQAELRMEQGRDLSAAAPGRP